MIFQSIPQLVPIVKPETFGKLATVFAFEMRRKAL
ncbi:hypothetical protein Bra1253DRAFT_06150 [Bradyrhizobium sp. WSM1253]|nr:hypothetical protein Bra1253DRAFT_06150 [Bradyrhizobium sp. WSM1253]